MDYADYQALLASRDWVGVRYPTNDAKQKLNGFYNTFDLSGETSQNSSST